MDGVGRRGKPVGGKTDFDEPRSEELLEPYANGACVDSGSGQAGLWMCTDRAVWKKVGLLWFDWSLRIETTGKCDGAQCPEDNTHVVALLLVAGWVALGRETYGVQEIGSVDRYHGGQIVTLGPRACIPSRQDFTTSPRAPVRTGQVDHRCWCFAFNSNQSLSSLHSIRDSLRSRNQ
jgi:hypothetical protein